MERGDKTRRHRSNEDLLLFETSIKVTEATNNSLVQNKDLVEKCVIDTHWSLFPRKPQSSKWLMNHDDGLGNDDRRNDGIPDGILEGKGTKMDVEGSTKETNR